tara:strand:- start:31 stop:660 length:630 start_codon:yes stop_codon:yes gene_type:complete
MKTNNIFQLQQFLFYSFFIFTLTADSFANSYLIDSSGQYVLNGYGECWRVSNEQNDDKNDNSYCDKKAKGDQIVVDKQALDKKQDKNSNSMKSQLINKSSKKLLRDIDNQFDFDSFFLREEVRRALSEEMKLLGDVDKEIKILGHTDSIGTNEYNKKLSEKRAKSAADYLSKQGIKNISIKGMGEKFPISSNMTDEGRAKNRRVEIHYE